MNREFPLVVCNKLGHSGTLKLWDFVQHYKFDSTLKPSGDSLVPSLCTYHSIIENWCHCQYQQVMVLCPAVTCNNPLCPSQGGVLPNIQAVLLPQKSSTNPKQTSQSQEY